MDEAPSISPEGELLFGLVSQRYGARLTAVQLAEVRTGIAALATAAAALRAVRLDNSLAPLTLFVPYRPEGERHA